MKQALMKALVAGGLLLTFSQAAAAAPCADRDEVIGKLIGTFNENPTGKLSIKNRHVLEVYTSQNSATWSILLHIPNNNLVCLAASGTGQSELDRALGRLNSRMGAPYSGVLL